MTTALGRDSIGCIPRAAARFFISFLSFLQENSFDVRIVSDPFYSRVFEVNKAE